ncbi:hypothetical protein D3C72_2366630 [compost metagenome]
MLRRDSDCSCRRRVRMRIHGQARPRLSNRASVLEKCSPSIWRVGSDQTRRASSVASCSVVWLISTRLIAMRA